MLNADDRQVNKVYKKFCLASPVSIIFDEAMNKAKYLSRIGIDEKDSSASLETLKLLQRQHLLHVPFENLDIHWKRPIVPDTEMFYKKIVGERRGRLRRRVEALELHVELLGREVSLVVSDVAPRATLTIA